MGAWACLCWFFSSSPGVSIALVVTSFHGNRSHPLAVSLKDRLFLPVLKSYQYGPRRGRGDRDFGLLETESSRDHSGSNWPNSLLSSHVPLSPPSLLPMPPGAEKQLGAGRKFLELPLGPRSQILVEEAKEGANVPAVLSGYPLGWQDLAAHLLLPTPGPLQIANSLILSQPLPL